MQETISKIKKGQIGEQIIIDNIKKNFDVYFKVVHNTEILNQNKKTELDIILILSTGIYIIESKNFKGHYIKGKFDDKRWTEIFYTKKGLKTYSFYNPIKQNEHHIDMISGSLDIDKRIFKSYIIFSDNIKIPDNIKQEKDKYRVINNKDLIDNLITDFYNDDINISHEEIDKLYVKLEYYNKHPKMY